PMIALVGYTNSGKSTLMNSLTGADVEAAARPFSTLDPTVRGLKLPGRMQVMLVDTVGFIHRLPHMLIEAFKATLEEVRTASMLLHVIDASSPLRAERMEIVDRVLEEIGAGATPRLIVMNKLDLLGADVRPPSGPDMVAISALRGEGLEPLLERVAGFFAGQREKVHVTLPAVRGDLIAMARRDGLVVSEEYSDGVVAISAVVSAPVAGRLRRAAYPVS
ncbi:MAG: HflX GTPase family protein, partial [Candidatus Binataceae bacterium]